MPEEYIDRFVSEERVDGEWRQITQGLRPIPNNLRLGARNAAFEPTFLRNKIKTLLFNNRIINLQFKLKFQPNIIYLILNKSPWFY